MATLFAILLILLGFALVHRLGHYFTQAANGLLSLHAVWPLLGLQAIRFLPILLPFALLLSLVLTLGRLHRDHEMAAIRAAGFGHFWLYRPLGVLCLPLVGILSWLSLTGVPLAMDLHAKLQTQARHEAELSLFTPGRFRELLGGRLVIYVNRIDPEHGLEQIFIQRHEPDHFTTLTTAWRGTQVFDEAKGVRYLVLEEGQRYEGYPGAPDFDSVTFRRLTLHIDHFTSPDTEAQRRDTYSMSQLMDLDEPWARAERIRRYSIPWMALILGLLAPLIAEIPPRSGRYSRVGVALLIWITYLNLLQTTDNLIRREQLPEHSFWGIHLAMVLCGLVYARWQRR